jgi:uncharacterized protein involved in exopolysaccharide biosynthesis
LQNITQPVLSDDQIDLKELFRVLWRGKKLIVAFSASFALIFAIVASMLPNKYISSSVLAPANPQSSGLPRSLSKFGGLASLAGFSGVGGHDEPLIAQEIIQSWGFIESFIERNNLQVQIYAVSGWIKETNSLSINEDIYDVDNQKWLILDDDGQTRAPTSWELYERFSKMLTLSTDSDSGMTNLSIEHYSPYIAKQWVDLIFTDINSYMQRRKLNKVNSNIEYLQAQVEKTSIADMEQVFYTLIEEEIKSKMLAEATPEHTFVVVSQSMVPEKTSGPNKIFILTIGTLFGFFSSILIVLIRHALFGPSEQPLN